MQLTAFVFTASLKGPIPLTQRQLGDQAATGGMRRPIHSVRKVAGQVERSIWLRFRVFEILDEMPQLERQALDLLGDALEQFYVFCC